MAQGEKQAEQVAIVTSGITKAWVIDCD